MENLVVWQVAMILLPIIATLIVAVLGLWSGKKTNINTVLIGLLGVLEMSPYADFLSPGLAAPLATGLAVAVFLSNTLLTERL